MAGTDGRVVVGWQGRVEGGGGVAGTGGGVGWGGRDWRWGGRVREEVVTL